MIIQTPSKQSLVQPHKKGYMINFNERLVEVNNESGTENWYGYDQVWVPTLDKESIVLALIREKYSINDEFKMARIEKESTEWKEYNAYVEQAIETAEEILNELQNQ